MKIACIHPAFTGSGGGERQILNLAIELQKKGHYVEIFTQYLDPLKCFPEQIRQVKIKAVFPNRITRDTMEMLANAFEKNKVLYKIMLDVARNYKDFINMVIIGLNIPRNFDIINCHNFPTEWAACIAKIKTKTPVVWSCNEPPFWFLHHSNLKILCFPLYQLWDRFLVKKYINRIVTLDKLNKQRVKEIYGCESIIVRSGIDYALLQDVSGERIRDSYDIKDSDFVLLQVGTLAEYKRQVDSIQALKILKGTENIKLIFAGESPRTEKVFLENLVKELGIADRVIFAGKVSDENLYKLYMACDILLFPAEQTWGLAAIEAMASSKPVIVNRNCGVAEVIEDGSNGFLVSSRSPEEMAEKVRILMADSNLYKSMGQKAREFVKANFSWEKLAEDYINIFEEVCNYS